MNCASENPTGRKPAAPTAKEIFAKILRRLLWIVPAAALLVVVLFTSIGHQELSATGTKFVFALIYSTLIALPSTLLLTALSIYLGARLGRFIHLARIVVLLFSSTAGCLAAVSFFVLLHMVSARDFWPEFWASYPFSVILALAIGLTVTSYETMRYQLQSATLELRTRQVEQERANKLLAEARLSSLESRIHPHFLFNTLNSIAALIHSDPQKAEDTVGKLASLLRFSLTANHSGTVALRQEVKIVRDYLEIEKTRFGSRLRYAITIPEEIAEAQLPPLALQTVVENAIRHVVAPRSEGAQIRISGRRLEGVQAGERICLEVMDDGPGFSLEGVSPDHGLGNLGARLELLYGSSGELEVQRVGDETAVRIIFPAMMATRTSA
jgi:sensor histidine kinase YesM